MVEGASDSLPGSDETLAGYDAHAAEYAVNYEGRADLEQLSDFTKLLTPGDVVVDVGCAAGRDTELLHQRGFQAIGIDLSEGLLEEARKRYPQLQFLKASMLQMPLPDESAGGVWSRASLVHMASKEEAQGAFKEFHRVLKPQGALYVRVKARQLGDSETGHEVDKISGGRARFFRYYTFDEITQYAQQEGFEIVAAEEYNERDRADHMADKSKIRDIDWIVFTARKA